VEPFSPEARRVAHRRLLWSRFVVIHQGRHLEVGCQNKSNWTNTWPIIDASPVRASKDIRVRSRTNSTTPTCESPTCLHPSRAILRSGVDASGDKEEGQAIRAIISFSRPLKTPEAGCRTPDTRMYPCAILRPSGSRCARRRAPSPDAAPWTAKASFPCAYEERHKLCWRVSLVLSTHATRRGARPAPIFRDIV